MKIETKIQVGTVITDENDVKWIVVYSEFINEQWKYSKIREGSLAHYIFTQRRQER